MVHSLLNFSMSIPLPTSVVKLLGWAEMWGEEFKKKKFKPLRSCNSNIHIVNKSTMKTQVQIKGKNAKRYQADTCNRTQIDSAYLDCTARDQVRIDKTLRIISTIQV